MTLSIKNLDRICFSIVVLVTLIGGYLVGNSWIKNQKTEVQEAELISKRSEELIQMERDLHQLKTALEIRREKFKAINEQIPKSADIGSFLKELNALIKKNKIALTSIRPMSPLEEEYHTRIPIQLMCKGSFGRIYDLLRDLENMKRVVLMEKIIISRSEVTKECDLELTMSILEYENRIKSGKGA